MGLIVGPVEGKCLCYFGRPLHIIGREVALLLGSLLHLEGRTLYLLDPIGYLDVGKCFIYFFLSLKSLLGNPFSEPK